jgi:hypothetical protein
MPQALGLIPSTIKTTKPSLKYKGIIYIIPSKGIFIKDLDVVATHSCI